jgi:hypothetical protein
MECSATTSRIDDLLDGGLEPAVADAIAGHLASCAACRQTVEHARSVLEVLREAPVPCPSAGFEARVLARATAPVPMARRYGPLLAAASVFAAIGTALLLGANAWRVPADSPIAASGGAPIQIAPEHSRTVNLVFASESAIDDVALIIELPMGVELNGYPSLSEVRWTTRLVAGKNILPLELLATDNAGGQLIARLRHKDKETIFRIDLAAAG